MKKIQTLNEEIQKMRKLMSFNINENSHDSLSEENFKKSTEGKNIDPEQKECAQVYGGPSEVAYKMSNELNRLLEKGLVNIKKQTTVTIVAKGAGELYFEIGDIRLSLGLDPESERLGYAPLYMFASKGGNIPFATDLPVSLFKEELLNSDKCFRLLYDRYESIRNQIDGEKISMKLVTNGQFGEGKIGVKMFLENSSKQLKKGFKKGTSRFVDFNNANLLNFDSPFYIKLNEGLFGNIQADWGVELTRISLDGAEVPKDWGEPDGDGDGTPTKCVCNDIETGEPIEYPCDGELPERCKSQPVVFKFVVDSTQNFEKDKAILTQAAKDIIDEKIVSKWNDIPQFRKEEYLQFLNDNPIAVTAYASIDALSNFPDGGRWSDCSEYGVGKGPRYKYNECLSKARANAVVAYLKTIANKAFENVNFEAVGKGETNEWSGLVWDQSKISLNKDVKSPYSEEQLRPDRRFDVAFPEYYKKD